jgi:hypothetical protein
VFERILAAARVELERVRGTLSAWSSLDVDLTDGEPPTDRAESRRALVIWALQYDRREGDLALLRRLVEQEARWRRAVGGGLGATAELAGFLLAGHRRVEDVWRHLALKDANFDTGSAYDWQYLAAGGVRETIEHVRAGQQPERDRLSEYLASMADRWDDPEQTGWWAAKSRWFPADPGAEDLSVWVDRALLLGDLDEARHVVDRWSADRPRDSSTLAELSYHRAELGQFAAAADALHELIERYPARAGASPAGDLLRLAELERRAGRLGPAWEALSRSAEAMTADPDWAQTGLGRSFVAEAVELAELVDPEQAGPIWAAVERAAGPVALAVAGWNPEWAAHFRSVGADAARRARG